MEQTVFQDERRKKVMKVDSDLFFRSLFDYNPDMVLFMDVYGIIAKVNKGFSETLGAPIHEIELSPLERYISPEEISNYKRIFQRTLAGEAHSLYTTFVHNHGSHLNVILHLIPAKSEGRVIGIFGIAKDLTSVRHTENELAESELKFSSIADDALVGIFIVQEDGIVSYGNKKLYQLLGIEEPSTPINLMDFIHAADKQEIERIWKMLLYGSKGQSHYYRLVKKDGTITEVESHATKINLHGKLHFVGTILDITELKKAAKLNEYLANHDYLTELPNQRFFYKKLDEALHQCQQKRQSLTVMFIDLDRFKYVNDTLGHFIGDKLLQAVSVRLKKFAKEDGILARLGGDEFALLFPNIGADCNQIIEHAKSIIELMEEPFHIEHFELCITASIGISIFPNDAKDAETLMKHADSALYKAKARGKNTYQIFVPSMDAETYKIFTLETDLRKAIDSNQFEIYYQPKINAHTYEIVGAEALIRWNHPEWGLVYPKEFIPIAEETGLIVELGKWIKETVCKQIKAWQEAGLPSIPVSVNLSPSRFLEKDLISHIEEIINDTELDPKYLQLEIVESSILENETIVFNILSKLKAMGIKVALDDFGTGYSSLSYLKRFTSLIDVIKIDQAFISNLSRSSHSDSTNFITKTIIDLARHFKIEVVAEGVETMEQLEILKKYKCTHVQGYLFSKPIPEDEFALLLKNGKVKPNADDSTLQETQKRRKYFRIPLTFPLVASMTLVRVHGRNVNLGKTEVLIENIGLGGLRYLSDLKLPVSKDILIMFETTILGKTVQLCGSIVWTKELMDDMFQYGVEFALDEKERMELAKRLNKLAIQLKNNPFLPDCSFIDKNPYVFFKYKKSRKDKTD